MYIQFNGAHYSGWQTQPNAESVQQTIERSMSLFLRSEIVITGAGRTDAGVHARLMVAHFDLPEAADCNWLRNKLNTILPNDISIIRIVPVRADAHARFDALSRTYRYYVVTEKSPFDSEFSWYIYSGLDFELMNSAAGLLLRTIDFTSFSKLHTDTKTNNCRVTRADWTMQSPEHWVFTITADRFLRNMVRAIVGTLVEVGRHRIDINTFERIIRKKDRCSAGDSAPACGLFLEDVIYPDRIFRLSDND